MTLISYLWYNTIIDKVKGYKLNFKCKNCTSFCCVVPPTILTEGELEKALEHKGKVVAIQRTSQEYILFVVKDEESGICPFVSKGDNYEYKCSIYDDRFMVCDIFDCQAKDYTIDELFSKQPNDIISLLTNKKVEESLPIGVFSKEIIDKYDISVVTQQEAIEMVNMTSMLTVMQLMEDLVLKNQKEIEKCGQ